MCVLACLGVFDVACVLIVCFDVCEYVFVNWRACICVFFGVCVQVFVLPVFEEHIWQLEEESGPQVRVVCV